MPMIDLTVPKGVLTPERTDHLIKELSRIIIHWEGAEYSSLYRYATRMYIHEAAGVAVAMKLHDPSKRPYYRLIVSVPQGTPTATGAFTRWEAYRRSTFGAVRAA